MSGFAVLSVLTTLAAIFAWINQRWLRLPVTIGLMAISLLMSLALVASARNGAPVEPLLDFVAAIDFDEAVLQGMLGALLFAGALHVQLEDLTRQRGVIAILATVGVLVSTAVIGVSIRLIAGLLGFDLPWIQCFLFGAIISPTDPVAVSAILRKAGVPDTLLAKVTGESLFNDGITLVLVLVLLEMASGGAWDTLEALRLFVFEGVGGLVYGALLGWIAYRMLRSVDDYSVEILITLAVVTGGYALASVLHVSGPLAIVVAGLFLGNHGRMFAMSEICEQRLDEFWELADEFLNAVLFVLIGIEVVAIDFDEPVLALGVLAIPVVLFGRWASVGLPILALRRLRQFTPHAISVLTWSGLRGAISVALALSLPAGPHRDLLVTATYIVVCFSILVQGLTVGPVVARLLREPAKRASAAGAGL